MIMVCEPRAGRGLKDRRDTFSRPNTHKTSFSSDFSRGGIDPAISPRLQSIRKGRANKWEEKHGGGQKG